MSHIWRRKLVDFRTAQMLCLCRITLCWRELLLLIKSRVQWLVLRIMALGGEPTCCSGRLPGRPSGRPSGRPLWMWLSRILDNPREAGGPRRHSCHWGPLSSSSPRRDRFSGLVPPGFTVPLPTPPVEESEGKSDKRDEDGNTKPDAHPCRGFEGEGLQG